MDTRKHIYISKDRAAALRAVFTHMQSIGLFGAQEAADSNLAAIIDYALNQALATIEQEQE